MELAALNESPASVAPSAKDDEEVMEIFFKVLVESIVVDELLDFLNENEDEG